MNIRSTSQFLIAVLLLAAPVAILAQGPPPEPPQHRGPGEFQGPPDPAAFADHQVKFMTRMLSLTEAQQKQAATIFGESATANSKLRDQLKTAHETLRTAVKNKNTAAVDQAATVIGSLTAQMIAGREKSRIAFAKTLTPEQQAKLDKLDAERPLDRMGPGGTPGWRHRPGPPHSPQGPDSGPGAPGGTQEPPPPGGGDSLL